MEATVLIIILLSLIFIYYITKEAFFTQYAPSRSTATCTISMDGFELQFFKLNGRNSDGYSIHTNGCGDNMCGAQSSIGEEDLATQCEDCTRTIKIVKLLEKYGFVRGDFRVSGLFNFFEGHIWRRPDGITVKNTHSCGI